MIYYVIEKEFKEKSEYIKINRLVTVLSIVFAVASLFFFKLYFIFLILYILILLVLIVKSAKKWGFKLVFRNKCEGKKTYTVNEMAREKEYETMKKYAINNNLYNIKILEVIVEHYRHYTNSNNSGVSFMTFVSIGISIVNLFVNGYNPWVIAAIFLILSIYFIYSECSKIVLTLRGEAGMYERLEEIFSKMCVECVAEKPSKGIRRRVKKKS